MKSFDLASILIRIKIIKSMKKNILILLTLLFSIALLGIMTSCGEDDSVTSDSIAPTSVNLVTEISTEPGEEIIFIGSFNDNLSLASISIDYGPWVLVKNIDLSDRPVTYDLNYSFVVPVDAEFGEHNIVITAKDVSGNSTLFNIMVSVKDQSSVEYNELYVVGSFMWWWGWDFPELSYIMYKDNDDPKWFETIIHVMGRFQYS